MIDVPELTFSDAQVEALAEWVQPLFAKANALLLLAPDKEASADVAGVMAKKFTAWFAGLTVAGYAPAEFERVLDRASEIALAKLKTREGEEQVLADAVALLLPSMARTEAAA